MKILFIHSYEAYFNKMRYFEEAFSQNSACFIAEFINLTDNTTDNGNTLSIKEFIDICRNFDVIILGVGGKQCYKLIEKIKTTYPITCPKIVTFFPGICSYKRDIAFLSRYASDVILFNRAEDLNRYCILANKHGFNATNAMILGFPYAARNRYPTQNFKLNDIQNFYFYEQEIIPSSLQKRKETLELLFRLCRRHPHKNFYLKVKRQDNSTTAHAAVYDYQALLQKMSLPDNFFICKNLDLNTLDNKNCILSYSSTALLEACYSGIPFISLANLGDIKKYSTNYFKESGAYLNIEQQNFDHMIHINQTWIKKNIVDFSEEFLNLIKSVNRSDNFKTSLAKLVLKNRSFFSYFKRLFSR